MPLHFAARLPRRSAVAPGCRPPRQTEGSGRSSSRWRQPAPWLQEQTGGRQVGSVLRLTPPASPPSCLRTASWKRLMLHMGTGERAHEVTQCLSHEVGSTHPHPLPAASALFPQAGNPSAITSLQSPGAAQSNFWAGHTGQPAQPASAQALNPATAPGPARAGGPEEALGARQSSCHSPPPHRSRVTPRGSSVRSMCS